MPKPNQNRLDVAVDDFVNDLLQIAEDAYGATGPVGEKQTLKLEYPTAEFDLEVELARGHDGYFEVRKVSISPKSSP